MTYPLARCALVALILLAVAASARAADEPSAPPSSCPVPVFRNPRLSAAAAVSTTDAIRIGILLSLTGAQANSERRLVDAALLAVEEINAEGGVLGKPIAAFTADGGSDPATFAEVAEKLITGDRVTSIFGCWTPASLKAVLPVVEKHEHLLWYPLATDGTEDSPRVIYGGSTPEQLVPPLLEWCTAHLGKRLLLIGSSDDFSHAAGTLAKAQLDRAGGTLVDAIYLKPEDHDLRELVQAIRTAVPDAVIDTLAPDVDAALFRELGLAGIGAHQVPVISLNLYEEDVLGVGPDLLAGHYAVHAYFQSVVSEPNRKFVMAFKRRYGLDRTVDDPMETIYDLVHLFAHAAEKAHSTDVDALRKAAQGEDFDGPGGKVRVDSDSRHLWKLARVGQIAKDGQFRIVWSTPGPLRPGRAGSRGKER